MDILKDIARPQEVEFEEIIYNKMKSLKYLTICGFQVSNNKCVPKW